MTLRLDWCSHEAARYAVEHWHYSRRLPAGKLVKVGVWESGVFVGCVVFGDGANAKLCHPYGLSYTEGCELVRIALGKHCAAVSKIVAVALKFLKERCSGIRLVISFADPERGHYGGIYQAGGWIYTGKSTPADEYIVCGVRKHGRSLRQLRSSHRLGAIPAANAMDWARTHLDPHITKISGSAKHRYLMPLDTAMRAQIAPLAKPYPKRAESIVADAPAVHAGEGGSIPTSALHLAATVRP